MGDGTYPGSVSMMTFCGGIVFFGGAFCFEECRGEVKGGFVAGAPKSFLGLGEWRRERRDCGYHNPLAVFLECFLLTYSPNVGGFSSERKLVFSISWIPIPGLLSTQGSSRSVLAVSYIAQDFILRYHHRHYHWKVFR